MSVACEGASRGQDSVDACGNLTRHALGPPRRKPAMPAALAWCRADLLRPPPPPQTTPRAARGAQDNIIQFWEMEEKIYLSSDFDVAMCPA